MQKIDLWRWAQYTVVGIFLLIILVFASCWFPIHVFKYLFPEKCLTTNFSQKHLSFIVFIIVLLAYLCGLIIWHVSLHSHRYLLYLIFRCFKKKALGTRDYNSYRVKLFRSFISKIKSERENAKLYVDEELGRDIPEYKHIVLELYRCTDTLTSYIGVKLVSSWQSCTMMLALLGTVVLGFFVAMASLLYATLSGNRQLVFLQVAKLIAFLVVYFAIGLSTLQRNRLLIRDLVSAYVLRKEKSGSEPAPPAP